MEIYATVSGSFNQFLPQIQESVAKLSALGIIVLSPKVSKPISQINGFVMLERDKGSPGEVERQHLGAIAKSDFLYIVNPGGYIGGSVAFEVGYAISKGVPIYSSDNPKDQVFSSFILSNMSLNQDLKKLISQRKRKQAKLHLKPSPTLADLQNYVANIVKIRGFSEEGLTDVALLLVEEVGELAKAIRYKTGLKVALDNLDPRSSLESELADCLIYLLDLANLSNIDLEKALREKEALNAQKRWEKN